MNRKKIYHASMSEKKAAVTFLILHKIHFRVRKLPWTKSSTHSIMVNGSIHQEDITILTNCMHQ